MPGALGDSVHNRSDGEHDSDEAEDLEDAIPYSEDFDDWPDAPVMLCPDPAAAHQVMRHGLAVQVLGVGGGSGLADRFFTSVRCWRCQPFVVE